MLALKVLVFVGGVSDSRLYHSLIHFMRVFFNIAVVCLFFFCFSVSFSLSLSLSGAGECKPCAGLRIVGKGQNFVYVFVWLIVLWGRGKHIDRIPRQLQDNLAKYLFMCFDVHWFFLPLVHVHHVQSFAWVGCREI